MRRVLMIWIVCLVYITANAQDSKSVEKWFLEYSTVLINKDFDKALTYFHDSIFEYASREKMKNVLNQINSPAMDIVMTMPEIGTMSRTKRLTGLYYVKFNSKSFIKMRFKEMLTYGRTTAEIDALIDQFKRVLVHQFGEENVSYDTATQFFSLTMVRPVIEASPDRNIWKFVIVDNDELIPILEKFIPKEILDLKVD